MNPEQINDMLLRRLGQIPKEDLDRIARQVEDQARTMGGRDPYAKWGGRWENVGHVTYEDAGPMEEPGTFQLRDADGKVFATYTDVIDVEAIGEDEVFEVPAVRCSCGGDQMGLHQFHPKWCAAMIDAARRLGIST